MFRSRALSACLCAAGWITFGLTVGLAAAPASNLYVNGALASRQVFQHNGTACVPVADVARALGMSVTRKSDGYALAPAGGANQVGGLTGNVGGTLSNGQFTFTVVKVSRTERYAKQFDTGEATPNSPGEDLVVVVCRLKNARPKPTLVAVLGGNNTALTDQEEHSYPVSRSSDARSSGPRMLPGSAVDFALVFSIPKTEKMKDLVYQIGTLGDSDLKDTTFRISLAAGQD